MEESNALSMARQWLMAGNGERALETVHRQLADAMISGSGLEQAHFDLAWVSAWIGQVDEAFDSFEKSCSPVPKAGDRRVPLYLRALRDHGLLLAEHGRFVEAGNKLERASAETGRLIGSHGAEKALLAEPWAQVLLSQGEIGRALELLQEAARTLTSTGHERLPGLLALLAEARGAVHDSPFADMPDLTERGADLLFQHLGNRAEESDPVVMERVYQAGVAWLERAFPDSSILAGALGSLARLSGSVGDPAAQVATIDRAIEVYRNRGEIGFAIQALQGRALALAEAGDDANAHADYLAALDQAEQIGNLPLMSQLARNTARFLADRNRPMEASPYHEKAIEWAREAAHPEMAGKALAALGLFKSHQGDLPEAMAAFQEALALLPEDDSHSAAVRDHLDAMNNGRLCVCLDPVQVRLRKIRRQVFQALPPRTARSVDVSLVSGECDLKLDLVRPLTPAEEARLEQVLRTES